MKTIADKETSHLPYPYGDATDDEKVLAAVLNALHYNSGVPHENIKVEVKRGLVVLSGIVCQEFERDLAERSASEAPGVVEVTNYINIES